MQVSIVYGYLWMFMGLLMKIRKELLTICRIHRGQSQGFSHMFPPSNCLVSNLRENSLLRSSCATAIFRLRSYAADRPLFSLRSPDPNGTHDILGLRPENECWNDHSETHGACETEVLFLKKYNLVVVSFSQNLFFLFFPTLPDFHILRCIKTNTCHTDAKHACFHHLSFLFHRFW